MNIAVTKTFARFINQTAKEMGFKCEAEVVELSVNAYPIHTGENIFYARGFGDYNRKTGNYKVIKVLYPEEYYACPRYLTTNALTQEFWKRGIKTDEEVKVMLRDMLEI